MTKDILQGPFRIFRDRLQGSFAPTYSFTAAVAHMDAFAQTRPEAKSADYKAGFDAAISVAIRVLVERSHTD